MKNLYIQPISIIRKDNLQRVDISGTTDAPGHYYLSVYDGDRCVVERVPFGLNGGSSAATVWLTPPARSYEARWVITDRTGRVIAEQVSQFSVPRKWTIYVMVSSHFDLGLPNAPYIQREESARFLELAQKISAETADRPEESWYRYVMEGTWVWNNYRETYGEAAVEKAAQMLRDGKLGVCACVAGNHIHTYGLEELCRSTYSRKWLLQQGISCKTMTMIDIPGLSWPMIQPYADAGIENIIFAPNNWGPHLSTVWTIDPSKPWYINNPESCGGGSRIDVRYESNLPMLFYWQGQGNRKMLVWASAQYGVGGERFGISAFGGSVEQIYTCLAQQLPLMEGRYPYDVWLVENYIDNMEPELRFTDTITKWNEQYTYPKIRTLGKPDEPFDLVRHRFDDRIPTLRGDITNGWAPHPLAAAAVLADSLDADRKLPTAEKLATLASVYAKKPYPAVEFERAWGMLIMNDEHSYGVGEYYGRDVAETWMQHRDWVQKVHETAVRETETALTALSRCISGQGKRILVFNPTAQRRRERIVADGECVCDIPAFGYRVIDADCFNSYSEETVATDLPPIIENDFYRIIFAENGSLAEIYDKQLGRVITDGNCNEMLYTRNNHRDFHAPGKATFRIHHGTSQISVAVQTRESVSGAELIQTITIPHYEKRIDLDNQVLHVRDMIVSDRKDRSRYDRYLYFAFPFQVKNCRRYCELGGIEAEYGVDLTGHSTDTYMIAHEYCCAENDQFGVGLIQLDSQLIEFDRIHPDKTDFGDPGTGSAMFSYVANSWFHHKHLPGGSSINYRFRYTITSFAGSHRSAGLPQMAERIANPVVTMDLMEGCSGFLPEKEMTFLETPARLVNLKRAACGNGIVVRLYRDRLDVDECDLISHIPGCDAWQVVSTDESENPNHMACPGFTTLWGGEVVLPQREVASEDPLTVGGVYTGLISTPRAASAYDAEPGTMYLLWGRCADAKLSHYELYRSLEQDFVPCTGNLIARIEPEKFVVGRYVDSGLAPNTRYYYRVRAVSQDGRKGSFSDVFSGLCRE